MDSSNSESVEAPGQQNFRGEAERRFAAVSARAAGDCRLGAESAKALYEQEMSLTKDYFAKSEKLSGFLIDRQGQYSQTTDGWKFKKAADAPSFDDQIGAISLLLGKIASLQHQQSANQAQPASTWTAVFLVQVFSRWLARRRRAL